MALDPSLDLSAARRAMLDSQLRPEGVNDPLILSAFAAVPREAHVPAALAALAYADRSLPGAGGQPMMAPAALGQLVQRLAPVAGERALIVAPASSYPQAILEALGVAVDSVAADGLDRAGASYDLILVDGALDDVPSALVDRLAPGGRLGLGLADRGATRLAIGRRTAGGFGLDRFADADLPKIAAFARPPAFTF